LTSLAVLNSLSIARQWQESREQARYKAFLKDPPMSNIPRCMALFLLTLHGNSEHMQLARGGTEAAEPYLATCTLPSQHKTRILELKLKFRLRIVTVHA